jgi:hypothetical protein
MPSPGDPALPVEAGAAGSFLKDCLGYCLADDGPRPKPAADLDWEGLFALACEERLTGLLYVLGRSHPGLWPAAFQARLRSARYRTLVHGGWCAEQVRALLDGLDEAGVAAVALKGWARMAMLYGEDPSRRVADDVDLLVLPEEAPAAEGVLQRLGYRGLLREPWPGYRWRYHNSWAYRLAQAEARSALFFSVGLHWGLLNTPFYDRRMPVRALLARARPVVVAGVAARGLAAEDDLVYACGHLAVHHGYDAALFRYYEIASLVRQAGPALDWAAVLARARAWRMVVPVQRTLARVERLWPGTVPAGRLAQIAALRPTRAERVIHRLLVGRQENSSLRAAVQWLTMAGVARRMRFALEVVFPSPAYMRFRYGRAPGGLWPLLYLRRVAAGARWLGATVQGRAERA